MTSATLAAPSAASARLAGPSAAGCGQPATCSLIASSAGVSRRASAALTSDFLPSRPVNRQALRAATGRKPRATSVRPGHVFTSADVAQLRGAREAIKDIITSKSCNPILIRLGWHDAGTFDKSVGEWPKQGGANGSIRFRPEIDHGANKGLAGAIALLQPVKDAFPAVSWADLFQLASATAVEFAGGPVIPMRYGRVDSTGPEDCTPEGNLPDAGPPSPAEHLRKVFYRMGLNDQEIVALSGAHTLGRAYADRSGWGKESTKYTKDGPGRPGGSSWTVQWLKFDNSYFKDVKAKQDEDLLVLPTDAVLFEDPGFKVYAEKYAADQAAFFKEYAAAHKALSELGAKFDPPQGVALDTEGPRPVKFVAAEYSSGNTQTEMSSAMKKKLRDEYIGLGGSPDRPLQTNYFLYIMIGVAVLAILTKLTGAI
ncbi:unnamed protein product [Closterium sp. Naga37s-1]|nr:unnamed protein product [Closterium sp. Naga37s-1]